MCFALVCTIGMLKFTGQSDCSKNKHMFTQSLYIHMNTSYWQWWSDFIKPRYLHLAIFFTTVNIWARESTITFKTAQQATTTAHTFISSFCFVTFSFFWTFESKFEQNWVVFDTLINNATHWSTVNKMTAGRQNHIHSGLPQPSDVIIFSFSFTFIMTCSEQMTTVKWQKSEKSEKKWHFEQNWAKLSRICQGPNTYFSILSKIEQNWAKLSRIYRGLPIPFLVLRAMLSNFEQNWAGFTRAYLPILFFSIAGNFEQNWAGFTGPTNTF